MANTIKELALEMFPVAMMTGHNCEFDFNEDKRHAFKQGANIMLNRLEHLVNYYADDGVYGIPCSELQLFLNDLRKE